MKKNVHVLACDQNNIKFQLLSLFLMLMCLELNGLVVVFI
jgi:hypothetical protein